MTSTLHSGLAFLLGFGCAFLPAYGPFVGLLLLFSERWALTRSDLLWAAAALFLTLPLTLHGGLPGLAFGTLQVGAVWLVYRAFRRLAGSGGALRRERPVSWGLLTGLFAIVLLGWLQVEQLNFAYKTLAQAITWESNAALYGHTVLTLGLLMAVLLSAPGFRVASLGLAALGILVSGSREAAIAWVALSTILLFVGPRRRARTRAAEVALLAVMLALASGLGPLLGWGRVGFLVDLVPDPDGGNLVQGSEIPAGDWWDSTWVAVETATETLEGQALTSYKVDKLGRESWLRLQQVIPIAPGLPYTASVWLKPEGDAQPGLQGWGQVSAAGDVFIVSSHLEDGEFRAGVGGPGEVLGSGVLAREGEWRRVYVSFIYRGAAAPLYWYVGLAPERRSALGSASFAGFQLERGETPSAYAPGSAARGLGLGVARVPYWQLAWQGFLERPLFGWGRGHFPDYVRANAPGRGALQGVPAHSHNLFLQVLFERGLSGFLGVLLVLAALGYWALRRRDGLLLLVFAAVLFANLFDDTLFYGGVIYPLAAVAGWRAATWQASPEESAAKQLGVRLALALADYGAAFVALCLSLLVAGWTVAPSTALLYALLLWPAMSWREGLYPGYGLTAPQELRKQVQAAAYAGLIFAVGALLFPELSLGRTPLFVLIALSLALLPPARALAKRALAHLGLWGRPVVILGAGAAGEKIARSLRRSPLEGLYPTAIFDDDPDKWGAALHGVPIVGPLREAERYAVAHGVSHVIVAIPTLPQEVLGATVNRLSRAFRQVQFVPELAGLPADDVSTSHLAGFLALEFHNGLYSRRNRVFKRSLDLVGGTLISLALSPLLVLVCLWVRFDSPGPAFYWSERVGRSGTRFACLKFRTMHQDAEARLGSVLAADPAAKAAYERYHKLEDDPRVTRAGRFLRAYSLDELAQLYNVLKGEMSLVGPRPYLARELLEVGSYGEMIFQARPGMTGYWQVTARNTVTFQERLEMESYYVRNWSVWWDIVILTQTASAVLGREGAS